MKITVFHCFHDFPIFWTAEPTRGVQQGPVGSSRGPMESSRATVRSQQGHSEVTVRSQLWCRVVFQLWCRMVSQLWCHFRHFVNFALFALLPDANTALLHFLTFLTFLTFLVFHVRSKSGVFWVSKSGGFWLKLLISWPGIVGQAKDSVISRQNPENHGKSSKNSDFR